MSKNQILQRLLLGVHIKSILKIRYSYWSQIFDISCFCFPGSTNSSFFFMAMIPWEWESFYWRHSFFIVPSWHLLIQNFICTYTHLPLFLSGPSRHLILLALLLPLVVNTRQEYWKYFNLWNDMFIWGKIKAGFAQRLKWEQKQAETFRGL